MFRDLSIVPLTIQGLDFGALIKVNEQNELVMKMKMKICYEDDENENVQ